MQRLVSKGISILLLVAFGNVFAASETSSYGPELEGFVYPYPVEHFRFASQGQEVQMSYMDISPKVPANGQTVVLMHGKNFCGATWESTISFLSQRGYRVIAPDQIGFCASSKPLHYQYSFQQLAANSKALLDHLGVSRTILVAHSTGGMLATRFTLMYPDSVDKLVMVNPIGLEDWKAKGVPSRTVDQWYENELKVSEEGIRNYERSVYYSGKWKPEYDRWVDMLAGLNNGTGKKLVAWNSALIYDMIYTQPVIYEFPLLKVPTTLMLGDKDSTAIGKDIAPPEIKAKLGRYDLLGKQVIKLIPNGRLVEFHGYGHSPQMENPDMFHNALKRELSDINQ